MKALIKKLAIAPALSKTLPIIHHKIAPFFSTVLPQSEQVSEAKESAFSMQRLRGGVLVAVGYLLSPLCWWNDLIINLPVAYGFGYLCSLFSKDFLIPGAIAGYWISNVAGVLLMQAGVIDMVQKQTEQRNLKKELLTGLLSSTAYTIFIVLLIQFKILDGLDVSLLSIIPH